MAAYNSLIHRLLSIPMSTTDYEEEVNTIKHIAVANGYKSLIVDKLLAKHKRKGDGETGGDKPKQKFVSCNYGLVLNHTVNKGYQVTGTNFLPCISQQNYFKKINPSVLSLAMRTDELTYTQTH